jgi:hypothetical protein
MTMNEDSRTDAEIYWEDELYKGDPDSRGKL